MENAEIEGKEIMNIEEREEKIEAERSGAK